MRGKWKTLGGLVVVLLVAAMLWVRLQPRTETAASLGPASDPGCGKAEALERQHANGQWVTVSGRVSRLLGIVHGQSRHQEFVLRCTDGHALLIVNNIDIGRFVPVVDGARVIVRGEFVWNPRGGLVHFTHHDPGGGPGGWIRYANQIYALAETPRGMA